MTIPVVETVELSKLRTDPKNPNKMSKQQLEAVAKNITKYGFNLTEEQWVSLMKKSLAAYNESMMPDTAIYVFLDWRRMHELIPLVKNNFHLSNMIVWDKMVHGLGSDYKYTHELIAVAKKGKPVLLTHQGLEYQDIWHVQRTIGKNDDHATAKPTQLLTIPIRHATKRGELVTDFFGGSGSTLIACEVMHRRCNMMELSPNYCQVVIDRWERFTNKKAKKAE